MSLKQRIVSDLLFPLQERLKRHTTLAAWRELERTQWWSAEELRNLQIRKLRLFLQRIGRSVPYYEELFSRLDFDPDNVSAIEDLRALPLLDKTTIREHTDRMQARGAVGLQRFNTGGSSGEPLVFLLGRDRVSHDVAAKRRATRWWNVDIGDPEIVIWGSPIELGTQDHVRLLRDRLFRTELISAFEMSAANVDAFLERILRIRPAMLFGYPSALALIAERARKADSDFSQAGIKVAFVTSERLYPHQRTIIEEVFGCPVANGYGGRDAGFIAHECPEGSLHITAEDMVLEIIDPAGDPVPAGESGEIVVTHLHTSEFPFLRYRTGDVGALSETPCKCGRGLPVLSALEGRTTDFVVAQDGTVLHGLALIYVLRDIDSLQAFRIHQKSRDHILVQLVTETQSGGDMENHIVREFRSRLGETVRVSFDYPREIPPEKSGKYRYIVSDVARDH